MSDFVIPGVTSSINTEKMVKAIMDVERKPLSKMKKDVENYEASKGAWKDLNLKLSKLKDTSNKLYGFQNPFNEKIGLSSNESILTATVTREAINEEKKVIVKQTAKADRFLSSSLEKDFKVEPGVYPFTVGDKEYKFKFNGGKLKDFASAINKRSGNKLKASVINDTSKTQVILIEGVKEGSQNRLGFSEKFEDFAIKAGIIQRTNNTSRNIGFDGAKLINLAETADRNSYNIEGKKLVLRPGAELKLPVTPAFSLSSGMVMELGMVIEEIPEEIIEEAVPPKGPDMPGTGEVFFKGMTLEYEKSDTILPDWEPPTPPEKVEDMQILAFTNKNRTFKLPEPDKSRNIQTMTIPIAEYTDGIDGLLLNNKNSHKIITIDNIKIYDPAARGDFKPAKPIDEARDAVLIMDGIEITRENNEIDDLLTGVNLTLHKESDEPVELTIKPNEELIKDSVINFVGHYNQIITSIDILSRNDPGVIENLEYMTKEEKDEAKKQLGLLQGEITLMQLKTRLQNVVTNPYPGSDDNDIKLLAQFGISTNTSRPGSSSSIDKNRLRGYLEINEEKLTEAVNRYPEKLKEFFGWDSDGDLIVDKGLGFTMDNNLRAYTSLGGILASKTQTLDSRIESKNKEIDRLNLKLEDQEAELKRKYASMEGMVESLKKSSEAIDNFNNQNKN